MKISVITTFYNAQETIPDTLNSVIKQDSSLDIEYVLIDALSSDNSLSIVNDITKDFGKVKIISEPDSGIYDGMNKGIKYASGDIIAIINADDYYTVNALKYVHDQFSNNDSLQILAASISRLDVQSNQRKELPRSKYSSLRINSAAIHHPAIFIRRDVYDTMGYYDTSFKVCADFDFVNRAQARGGFTIKESDFITTIVREGGVSEDTRFQLIKLKEQYRASIGLSFFDKLQLLRKAITNFLYLNKKKMEKKEVKGDETKWFH
ncbi:glycosyltransferase [Vibrio parahaemolyticus]|uniref:glycosyltransferase n=1 Tax=Vibrio harveyi group TaxID=717610 RepID=UPI0008139503|nr:MULTISPECIES: glycosyltransferase [Vibrio harveyi group]EJC6862397.1 glycosyltransferase [Vibrio parahaemolyticus]EJC7040039.1 glycosyltransferase [Vibrio parahaemolyticus]EKA4467571.1 glycosyltransferase [Vibrio parahaemolyticus]ELA8155596.1 glycosyltransferase [Vibrio parahaemolyticus]